MTKFYKQGLALLCALFPVFLLSYGAIFSVPENPSVDSAKPSIMNSDVADNMLRQGLSLWRDNQYQQAAEVFSAIEPNLSASADLFRFYSQNFIERQNSRNGLSLSPLAPSCKQQILFVTSDIDSLPQAERFRTHFIQDSRLATLPICIHNLIWFTPKTVDCNEDWQQGGRLGCNLEGLASQLKALTFTHLVVFAEKGKANVHNGIMFLDRQDTYDVFVHELAHFSGFVDEYPLSANLAKRICKETHSPNIVIQTVDAELKPYAKLTPARTCDNHPNQAFKLSNQLTFMEYHDTAFIPQSYIAAWERYLSTPPSLPSAHINFAQLFEQSDNSQESHFWRERYKRYLNPL